MSESTSQNLPIMSVAVSPSTGDDRQLLQQVLSDLARQDPTIKIETDPIDGQMIIGGMGELHLGSLVCVDLVFEMRYEIVGQPGVKQVKDFRFSANKRMGMVWHEEQDISSGHYCPYAKY